MQIVNSGTNTVVGGVRLPLGAFEWPDHGTLSVVLSSGYSTNLVVGSGDTILLDDSTLKLSTGVDVFQAVLLGFLLSFGYLGLLCLARSYARRLSGGAVREV